jgi:3-hydroxybutyryl-CoA dehydrogenase
VRLLDQGYATREDIDAAMTLGCRHPLGPLALLDLIGLDSAYEICDALWREFGEHLDPPASLLRQYMVAGYLGRKEVRGFYRYEAPGSSEIVNHQKNGSRDQPSGVQTVGVVGTGLMASGIAQVAAEAGNRVLMWGRSSGSLEKARASIAKSLGKKAAKKRLEPSWVEEVIGRIEPTGTLSHLAEADLVVEAVAEDLDLKKRVFRELDLSVKPSSVIATTTSSLPIVELAAETGYPGRVIGVHFFNPAPLMKLVEVVGTVASEQEVEERAAAWVREVGKEPVRCSDRPGFIVNFLLFPYLNDAVRMVEAGYGTPADIDNAVKLGCGHPMGPFELMDTVGLDVTQAVLESLHKEFREPRYAPASLLGHMVLAGHLGRKTRRGFHLY